ncbi:hypothetical protein BOX15_Mlig031227g1 [Macrostomum lignano]|uniref:Folylpolyglutamate synthase n=1 Tax=Macrostomum lignano TaxID=282301 RepID=A0A267GLZ5_9PLAT|nr:hypothetical protein BOX15_Mlig031227g1 [Macrostomum lignano]
MSNSRQDQLQQDYPSAVRALNKLQSNAANLEQVLREKDSRCGDKIPEMMRWAAKLDVTPADYNSLRVIHVTGTKGKGGTSAYAESILRCHGYRTGFFSSPHLVEVRERIRINGRPLSREQFAKQFWRVHGRLIGTCSAGEPEPAYFPFLTLMAVWTFLAEKVDVAIVEVGIGGRYDSTNFVSSPWVCAFSPLGLDHTALLGNSIAEIAWQKAGIMKPGCPSVTVYGQPEEGLAVLQSQSADLGCPLLIAPELNELPESLAGRLAPSQKANAALAVAVCRVWLRRARTDEALLEAGRGLVVKNPTEDSNDPLDLEACNRGLSLASWPGRYDVMPYRPGVTLYIDGAHTVESVSQAASWFANLQQGRIGAKKKLLFNRTGDRRPKDLLAQLVKLGFVQAAFCPNVVDSRSSGSSRSADLFSALASGDSSGIRLKVEENKTAYEQLDSQCDCRMFDSVAEALEWLVTDGNGSDEMQCDVLVTGSLHLVGCLYAMLAPQVADGETTGEARAIS